MNFSQLHRRSVELTKLAQVDAYQQKTQWSCSAGALKAVLQHYGIDLPEETIVEAIGAREGRGAETTDIVEGARKLGLEATEGSFPSLDSAKETLSQGTPIIADVQSFNYPGKGHYVVISGWKPGKGFIIMDPNTKGKTAVDNWRLLPDEKMEKVWWDRAMAPPHEMMVRWGVVVTPKQEQEKVADGFSVDIDDAATQNDNFRKVLFTAGKEQLVVMSIPPGGTVGEETHPHTDQFIRVESGSGQSIMDGVTREMTDGTAIVVPAGTKHNVVNTGTVPLKLYTVYSPPHHPDGEVERTKAEAAPVEKAHEKLANGDMLQYFADHPKKLREYQERQRRKKEKKAAGDLFGWKAQRRAKAESSASQDATDTFGKLANDSVKKRITMHGIPINIEWKKGEFRKYYNHDPLKKKSTGSIDYNQKMKAHYGYVRNVIDADGEELDVYIGSNPDSQKVFVLEKLRKHDGNFDENKIMLGYDSMEEAKKSYLEHQDKEEMGKVREVTLDQFKKEFLSKSKTASDVALQSFVNELVKIGSIGTPIEAAIAGGKAGSVLGGLFGAAKGSQPNEQGETSMFEKSISGVARGALIGALIALGLQRNAAGLTTLPRVALR